MKKFSRLCRASCMALLMLPSTVTLAAGPLPPAAQLDVQKQISSQGPMLLGRLRQARKEALRRDLWGMTYSLQEARRLLEAMSGAERSLRLEAPPDANRSPGEATMPGAAAPLGEPLELDRPESGGRQQAVGRFEGDAGSIPLAPVKQDLDRALAALRSHPPAVGAALLATEDALRQVRWKQGLEPKDWAAV